MLNFFKKKEKEKKAPELLDINGELIQEGDTVESYRYDLGDCKVILEGLQYFYESEGGERVSYVKMVDAITGNQKVKKK